MMLARRQDLAWPRRGIEGLRYAAAAALISIAIFAVLILVLSTL